MKYFFLVKCYSLNKLYEETPTATMKCYYVVEQEIRELMAEESRQIETGIDAIVESIQNTITVSQLPQELLSIMNMWMRTDWYHTDRVPKFEHCLRTIVVRESKFRVFYQLVKQVRDCDDQMVDDEDLRYVVNRVSNALVCGRWQTMDIELVAEAKRWVSVQGEHVTAGDGGHFQWYDSIKEVVCYHLPHIPKHVMQNDEQGMLSLETLPCDFQHEADWTCAICLDVDASVPRCVRTECAHIYHELCLKNHYLAFLKQKKNYYKTCFSCPLCRVVIN